MENSSALKDVCECLAPQAPLQRVCHSVVYERNIQAKKVLHAIICEATYKVNMQKPIIFPRHGKFKSSATHVDASRPNHQGVG